MAPNDKLISAFPHGAWPSKCTPAFPLIETCNTHQTTCECGCRLKCKRQRRCHHVGCEFDYDSCRQSLMKIGRFVILQHQNNILFSTKHISKHAMKCWMRNCFSVDFSFSGCALHLLRHDSFNLQVLILQSETILKLFTVQISNDCYMFGTTTLQPTQSYSQFRSLNALITLKVWSVQIGRSTSGTWRASFRPWPPWPTFVLTLSQTQRHLPLPWAVIISPNHSWELTSKSLAWQDIPRMISPDCNMTVRSSVLFRCIHGHVHDLVGCDLLYHPRG